MDILIKSNQTKNSYNIIFPASESYQIFLAEAFLLGFFRSLNQTKSIEFSHDMGLNMLSILTTEYNNLRLTENDRIA